MKVLVLVSDRVVPAITGTRVRNYHLWPSLKKKGVDVRIVGVNLDRGFLNPKGPPGVSSCFFSHKKNSFFKRAKNVMTKSFQEWPRSPEIVKYVKEISADWKPNIIHAEEMRMAYYLPKFQGYSSSAIQTITYHNVESDLLKKTGSYPFQFGKLLIEKVHQGSLRKYERKTARVADMCFAYSEVDKARYKELYPSANWTVTRNGTNALSLDVKEQVQSKNLLIIGSLSYAPNIEGLYWFLDRILPKLPEDFSVTVAGSRAPDTVKEKIELSGVNFVDTPLDLAPHFHDCALCVVPVFQGSGTRGKVLESLAQKRMVVTTSLGVEGLPLDSSTGVIVSNEETEFLKQIICWTESLSMRKAPASMGREFVIKNFDWSVVADELLKEWKKLCDL